MKRVAGRQTRYVNMIERRTGSLCKGRFKSSPISTDEYFLACCRYIELNPLRADIVANPADYLWSSYGAKIGVRNVFLTCRCEAVAKYLLSSEENCYAKEF